jgi:RNA polymerase sigma-70 factor, ECF subfamily
MEFASFDEEYVRKLADGDPEVEKHFTDYFGSLLLIKLRARQLRSSHRIDDIRQEVFLRVLQAVRTGSGIRQPERFGAFVISVCNNVVNEDIRDGQRHPQPSEPMTDPIDAGADAESEFVNWERKNIVKQVLAELPAKDRKLLELSLQEVDKSEICKKLGVTDEYLRVLLHRAKARFKEVLLRITAATL